ncbi:hypothetical protein L1887_18361 [Cichorium endivia]|nr:hypothetical protein L1887_18361 [Cichorium endivia]
MENNGIWKNVIVALHKPDGSIWKNVIVTLHKPDGSISSTRSVAKEVGNGLYIVLICQDSRGAFFISVDYDLVHQVMHIYIYIHSMFSTPHSYWALFNPETFIKTL